MNKEFITSVLDGIDENYIAEALCPDENRMAGLRYRDNTELKGVIDDPISDYINNRTVDLLWRIEAIAWGIVCLMRGTLLPFSLCTLLISAVLFLVGGMMSTGANLPVILWDHDEEALRYAKKKRRLFLILRCIALLGIVLTAFLLILGK